MESMPNAAIESKNKLSTDLHFGLHLDLDFDLRCLEHDLKRWRSKAWIPESWTNWESDQLLRKFAIKVWTGS